MLTTLVLAATLAAAPADTARGTIRGSVLSEGDGLPLPMAVVEVDDASGSRSVATDSAGNYVLPGVPAGRRTLRVRHLEHAPLDLLVLVPPRGEVSLEVSLKPAPLVLPGVDAVARIAGAPGDATPASRREAALVDERVFEARVPLGNAPAGGAPAGDSPDPRDVLYVRGAAADLKLVLLDGAPIYAPFHMGGLIETFEPQALGSARLYLGGAPARYDGGLSYVMEMRTRAGGDAQRTTGSVDVVSARVLTEGPLAPGATYLASFRGVHGAALSRVEDVPFPYQYAEGLARFDFDTEGGGSVRFTGFTNREGVRVDTVADGRDFARWRNSAVSLQYAGPLAGVDAEATAAISEFRAVIPTHGIDPMTSDGRTRRLRLALDLSRQRGASRMRYGVSYDRTWLTNVVREYLPIGEEPQAAWVVENRAAGDVGGVYVDAALQPTPRMGIRIGARGDYFSTGGVLSLSPRVAATWLLTDHAALTLAGGRYHQYVRVPRDSDGAPGSDTLGLSTVLSVARATHVALSLDQQLTPELRMGLEGYFKHYEGLALAGEDSEDDQAYISGVDVWARRPLGPVSGWVGYSLTWAWRLPYDGQPGSEDFAGRHVVTAGIGAPLGSATQVDVRLAYGAGLDDGLETNGNGGSPSLPELSTGGLDNSGEPVSFTRSRREPYVRIDAQLSRTWRPTWGGRRRELTPYLRVLNGLDRRDALFYRYDEQGRSRALGSLPIVPVAGFTFRF